MTPVKKSEVKKQRGGRGHRRGRHLKARWVGASPQPNRKVSRSYQRLKIRRRKSNEKTRPARGGPSQLGSATGWGSMDSKVGPACRHTQKCRRENRPQEKHNRVRDDKRKKKKWKAGNADPRLNKIDNIGKKYRHQLNTRRTNHGGKRVQRGGLNKR